MTWNLSNSNDLNMSNAIQASKMASSCHLNLTFTDGLPCEMRVVAMMEYNKSVAIWKSGNQKDVAISYYPGI